jgi:iron complex outermembrane receptor protein
MYGIQYRLTHNHTDGFPTFEFDPSKRTDETYSWFIQDTFAWVPDLVNLTVGSKFEHNDYSGWEMQPNGRIAWTPDDRQTLWGAISRAVRTPSALEQDIVDTIAASTTTPTFMRLTGNKDFRSEEVLAYELGYRVQPLDPVLLSIAGFYNVYDRLVSIEQGAAFSETSSGMSRTIVPISFGNNLRGHSHGLEFTSTYFVNPNWRLRGNYSFITLNLRTDPRSSDMVSVQSIAGSTAQHQVFLQSLWNLPYGLEIDPKARFVDNLPSSGVPSYWTCDLHLGWHLNKNLEFSLVGQNLIKYHHPEATLTTEIPRGIYGQLSYRTW